MTPRSTPRRPGRSAGPIPAYRIRTVLTRHAVALISCALAFASCALVPPDAAYLSYLDLPTLAKLAAVLVSVAGLQASGVIQMAAAHLVSRCSQARTLVLTLTAMCALASMFITNDMALIAFLPLSAATLIRAGRSDLMARCFVLEGLAANLCGMLLPFGNPQNIYLCQIFGISLVDCARTMALPFAVSCLLILLGVVWGARSSTAPVASGVSLQRRQALLSGVMMLLSVCMVLNLLPYLAGLCLVLLLALLANRQVFKRVDVGLLVTFAAFFVFSGNLARMPGVQQFFSAWTRSGAFLPAVLLSQIVSNVPAAIILSRFTSDATGLLLGVNVGGAGTPIASLATLIVITQYLALGRSLSAGRQSARKQATPQLHPAHSSPAHSSLEHSSQADGPATLARSAEAASAGEWHRSMPDTGRFLRLLLLANIACLAVLVCAVLTGSAL